MRSSGSLSDVIHRLSLPSHPLSELQDLLRELALLIKQEDTNSSRSALKDVVGFFLEAYRCVLSCLCNGSDTDRWRTAPISTRARNTSSPEQDELSVRWRTAQDICSVIACHSAFEEYKDGDLLNLSRGFQLIPLRTNLTLIGVRRGGVAARRIVYLVHQLSGGNDAGLCVLERQKLRALSPTTCTVSIYRRPIRRSVYACILSTSLGAFTHSQLITQLRPLPRPRRYPCPQYSYISFTHSPSEISAPHSRTSKGFTTNSSSSIPAQRMSKLPKALS